MKIDKTFLGMFADVVKMFPDKVAIVDRDGQRSTTYAELDALSGRVCAALQKRGLKKGFMQPICMDRCMEFIAAEIGVLKCGGAFIALLPDYPKSRNEFIREDCGADFIMYSDFIEDAMALEPSPGVSVSLDDTAFAIYTSGSTGNPKGVLHSHRSMAASLLRHRMVLENTLDDIQLSCVPLGFVVMLMDIYTPLSVGHPTHILPEEKRRDIKAIEKYIIDHKITISYISPQLLKLLRVESKDLRLVCTGSERLSRVTGHGYRLMNRFGCSETASFVLNFEVTQAYDNTPIGKPVPGIEAYLIDEQSQRIEAGIEAEGELVIVGDIAHSYHNLPEKTKEVMQRLPDGRMRFRTGDICRQLADGTFIYGERKDWMVKINGQRVEVNEIERVLSDLPGVGSGAVKSFVNANGQNYLCAYYTAEQPIHEEDLLAGLRARLPEYMVPRYFVHMDALPLNANNKLDRKNLKAPDVTEDKPSSDPPVTEKEKAVCAAFEKVLGRTGVGRKDNFFSIGGDSIQAIMLTLELDGLEASDIYTYRTPEAIAAAWSGGAEVVNGADEPKFQNQFDENGRMTILTGVRYYNKTADQNNMPRFYVKLKDPVDGECLKAALEETLPRFKVMCMKVVADDARYYLAVNDAPPILHVNDGTRYTVGGPENNGYITRVGYAGNEITIDKHHGLTDGMGSRPFTQSLLYAYCHRKYGTTPDSVPGLILPDTPEDPREYADCMLFVPEEPVQPYNKYKWEKAFQLPDPQMDSAHACAHYHVHIDAPAMERFIRENETSASAAFSLLINRVIAQKNQIGDVPIVSAVAVNARNAYHAEKTQQCCVGTLPVYYDTAMDALPLRDQLNQTREIILTQSRSQNIIFGAQQRRKFNYYLEEKFPTLQAKKACCLASTNSQLDTYTYGFSYSGEYSLGQGIDEHVSEVGAMVSANMTPIVVEALKFGDHYHLTWLTHLQEDPYVTALCDFLNEQGIATTCEHLPDFEESIALFGDET